MKEWGLFLLKGRVDRRIIVNYKEQGYKRKRKRSLFDEGIPEIVNYRNNGKIFKVRKLYDFEFAHY